VKWSSFGDDSTEFGLAKTTWTSVPIDHLWMRLQYIDEEHGALLDLALRRTNPFYECLDEYTRMLLEPLDEGPLSALGYHFQGDTPKVLTECRTTILNIATQVWYWFILPLDSWPLKSLGMIHPASSEEEVTRIADELYDSCECCLDDHCSLKVRATTTTATTSCQQQTIFHVGRISRLLCHRHCLE
jgi:hypothetical protein